MINNLLITSKANSLIKEIALLKRSSPKRQKAGVCLIEGFKLLIAAIKSGQMPELVLYDESKIKEPDKLSVFENLKNKGTVIRPVVSSAFLKLSSRDEPLDCLAIIKIKKAALDQLELKEKSLVVVAENIEKPGNLGTLIRTAHAAGAGAFIAADAQTDIYSPACIQASLGAIFQMPVINCSSQEAIGWLEKSDLTIVSTSPNAKKIYYDFDLTQPLAIVIGHEYRGLSKIWLNHGISVRIPMLESADSLNGTIAAAVVLFEALRQRALKSVL
jgi:TrmH family RNA methyltransferase